MKSSTYTFDNRPLDEVTTMYAAEVEALRRRVRELETELRTLRGKVRRSKFAAPRRVAA